MRTFEVYIEVDDKWVSMGAYEAESGEDAVSQARGDSVKIGQYYPARYLEFVNLDFVDLSM